MENSSEAVLDLSGKCLKKLERSLINQFSTTLILDDNQLQNLSNLDSYGALKNLSAANNQLVRMYWFTRMYSLRVLNLPNNNIVHIEGLRELQHLFHLNISNNNIKSIEGLNNNIKLEHVNLSANSITQIGDLSALKNLHELFLHRNNIKTLQHCNKYLLSSLCILTLSDNQIIDLNELCNLSHLSNLEQFTFLNNPCLDPVEQVNEEGESCGQPLEFDCRPYVINWCLNLQILDGLQVTPKESLKAEWLYSQGRGRGFQIGEHYDLVLYLSGICLVGGGWGGADLPDEDEKLGKILQLAQLHQEELRCVNGHHEHSDSSSGCGSKGSDSTASLKRMTSNRTASLKKKSSHKPPVKLTEKPSRSTSHSAIAQTYSKEPVRRNVNQVVPPSTNPYAYHVELSSTLYGNRNNGSLMTQSLDPTILAQNLTSGYCEGDFSAQFMTKSLGPDHLSTTFKPDPYTSLVHETLHEDSLNYGDIMTTSMGEEQLRRVLRGGKNSRPRIRSAGHGPQCYYSEMEESFDLDGTSEFIPIHEEIKAAPRVMSAPSTGRSHAHSVHYSPRSDNRPVVNRAILKQPQLVKSHTTSNVHGSLDGSQTPSPRRNPISQPIRGGTSLKTPVMSAPNSRPQNRSASVSANFARSQNKVPGTGSSAHQNNSPRTIPRATRTKFATTLSQSQSMSGDSDTDSEVSISKLESIKSIAAERKGKDKGTPRTSRSTSDIKSSIRTPCQNRPPNVPPVSHRVGASVSRTALDRSTSYTDSNTGSNKARSISNSKLRSAEKSVYDPDKYKRKIDKSQSKSDSSCGSMDSLEEMKNESRKTTYNGFSERNAAVLIQRFWRKFRKKRNCNKENDYALKEAKVKIRVLTEKLHSTESALVREKKLRHMQLDAIRSLWREIQKLQTGRKDGLNTPSTPMTPLTPLTPLENKRIGGKTRVYSEDTVNELKEFCSSLQSQVTGLQDSLAMVTQVMNSFCSLPNSKSVLSQINEISSEKSPNHSLKNAENRSQSALEQSVASLTSSISALTSSIGRDIELRTPQSLAASEQEPDVGSTPSSDLKTVKLEPSEHLEHSFQVNSCHGSETERQDTLNSTRSASPHDMNSTCHDVSQISNDSILATEIIPPYSEDLRSSKSDEKNKKAVAFLQKRFSEESSASEKKSTGASSNPKDSNPRPSPQRPSTLPVPKFLSRKKS